MMETRIQTFVVGELSQVHPNTQGLQQSNAPFCVGMLLSQHLPLQFQQMGIYHSNDQRAGETGIEQSEVLVNHW